MSGRPSRPVGESSELRVVPATGVLACGLMTRAGGRHTVFTDGQQAQRRSYGDSVMEQRFLWDGEKMLRQTDGATGGMGQPGVSHPGLGGGMGQPGGAGTGMGVGTGAGAGAVADGAGGAGPRCRWLAPATGRPWREGRWCCRCSNRQDERFGCIIEPPPIESHGGQKRIVESYDVSCGAGGAGAQCDASFRIWLRRPTGWYVAKDNWQRTGTVREYAAGRVCQAGAGGVVPTAGEKNVCGPEIKPELRRILSKVRDEYNTLAATDQTRLNRACRSIDPVWHPGDVGNPGAHFSHAVKDAWDIGQLRDGDYTGYGDRCAMGSCRRSVMVGGKCFTDAAVNYVLFGLLARMCGYSSLWTMALVAASMSVKIPFGIYTPAAALSALKWAAAGWAYYPTGSGEPPEERGQCPACGLRIPSPGGLSVTWDYIDIF